MTGRRHIAYDEGVWIMTCGKCARTESGYNLADIHETAMRHTCTGILGPSPLRPDQQWRGAGAYTDAINPDPYWTATGELEQRSPTVWC